MAFKSKTSSLLHAGDRWKSVPLFENLVKRGWDVIEGVFSWGGRKGAEVQSLKGRIGGAKAEVFAPLVRSSVQPISVVGRVQKPSTVVKNIFGGLFLRSRPQSLISKYAAKITPQPCWSSLRSPEAFRSLAKGFAMYSLVGLSLAANCQQPQFISKDLMNLDEVWSVLQKKFSERSVYEASCASVEKVESAKLDDYDIGQLMACNGLTACFEAKFKSCDDHQNNVTWSEPCSFEEINEHESDASFVSEEEDISMLSDVPSLESEVTRAVEVVISREKQLLDIYEALREQKEKLSSIVNQMLLRDGDIDDGGSDSSIEVIDGWQEDCNDHVEETSINIDMSSFDNDNGDDDDGLTNPGQLKQLHEVSVLAKKQQMDLSELLATLLDHNRRLQTWASSCKPRDDELWLNACSNLLSEEDAEALVLCNDAACVELRILLLDFNLVLKVRWMTDCSPEFAAGVLMSELLPTSECYSVDQDWSRNGVRLPSHFNVLPVIGGFLTTLQQLKVVPACRDALPSVSSWQQDIAVCVVTKRFDLTLAEFLASHDPGIPNAMRLFLQLLEAVNHLGSHKVCHRNLKSDNIFIEQLADGPHLLVANFGSSFHITTKFGLPVADANDMRRCSGSYLMAPECFAARSPLHQAFTKADLWACGAIAYEVFGAANPFRQVCNGKRLTSSNYQECDLPDLPDSAPSCINQLVKLMLRRDPEMRPDPELIANALHLKLWAPDHWRHSLPSRLEIRRWMTQFAAETFLLSSPYNCQRRGSISVVNALKMQFLSRANQASIAEAAQLLWDVSADEN